MSIYNLFFEKNKTNVKIWIRKMLSILMNPTILVLMYLKKISKKSINLKFISNKIGLDDEKNVTL